MDQLLPVDVLSRWIHIGLVIVLVGGSAFMRIVLIPAGEQLPDEHHRALRENVLARWRKIVGIGIGLILISGFYNYFRAIPGHKGQGLYHGLVGTKILLAFALFFLASALTGRAEKFEPMRRNSKRFLGILLLLAALIIGISGYAKVALPPKPTDSGESTSAVP
jgi:uncharacterized membrane protein